MTDQDTTEISGLHRIVDGVDRVSSELTVFATFIVIYLWVFSLAHAMLGRQHWGWLFVGPALVVPLLVLGSVLLHARKEFFSLLWVKTGLCLVASIRNLLSAGALLGLARYLNDLTEQAEPTTAAQVIDGLVRVVTGG